MTNWERWQKLTEGLPSPQNYVDWGALFLVSASLQRRVWCPPDWRPCFANIYVTLVGKPGIGKGQLIKCIYEILRFYKKGDVVQIAKALNPKDQAIVDAMVNINQKEAEKRQDKAKKDGQTPKSDLLFPTGANCVTYEQLVHRMAQAIDRINYHYVNGDGEKHMGICSHTSMYFLIEEMASLFKKHTESLINFFLEGYDCNEEYEYDTKNQGTDRIRKMCLSYFAGTTPDYMQKTFDDKITDQGYSSRQFFVYAERNRKTVAFLPNLTPEQLSCKKALIEHTRELSKLHGQCIISQETQDWLQHECEQLNDHPESRVSKSPKLDAYYARWNIHCMKVAMCRHFLESTDMTIPHETFLWTKEFLRHEEKTMHYALLLSGTNPLAKISASVKSFLAVAGPQTFVDLLTEFYNNCDQKQLEEVLQMLQDVKQIVAEQQRDSADEPILYYKIRK